MPVRLVASADGRQVIVPDDAVGTVPEILLPSVTVMVLPVCRIVPLKTASVVTKLPPRLRSVALLTRFRRGFPVVVAAKSIVSDVVPFVTLTRMAVEVPVQPERIDAGAI